jgi:hypothetical protein
MAQRIIRELIDDIDGSEAESTVEFTFRGNTYELDLSAKNIARLDKALSPFLEHARRLGRTGAAKAKTKAIRVASDAATVRIWATSNGYEVPVRGRIPNDIRAAYEAANS